MPSKNQQFGKWGENKACDYLRRHGYAILQKNYHASNLGEIDVIAKQHDELVFIEVKAKRNEHFGLPEEELTESKKEKLEFAILYYLEVNGLHDHKWRLDLIAIEILDNKIQLRHYKYVS
jgi:putative endonuclease